MQFNRNEYLNGNFNLDSVEEKRNAYFAYEKKGLDWNNYIKDYVKKCLGDAIATFSYPWQLIQPFANLGPFIDLGLFQQAADYLETLESENDSFNANKLLWVNRLRLADDYEYQKSTDSSYKTFTMQQMIENETINDYLKTTNKSLEDLGLTEEQLKQKTPKTKEDLIDNLKKFKDPD